LICPLKTGADVLTKLLKHCRIPDPNRSYRRFRLTSEPQCGSRPRRPAATGRAKPEVYRREARRSSAQSANDSNPFPRGPSSEGPLSLTRAWQAWRRPLGSASSSKRKALLIAAVSFRRRVPAPISRQRHSWAPLVCRSYGDINMYAEGEGRGMKDAPYGVLPAPRRTTCRSNL